MVKGKTYASIRRAFRRFYKPANVLHLPQLDVEYNEPRTLVLHGAFEAFCLLVEQEKVFEGVDFDPCPDENAPPWYDNWREHTRVLGKEIEALHKWWRKERPARVDPFGDSAFVGKKYVNSDNDHWFIEDDRGRNVLATPTSEYSAYLSEREEWQQAYDDEDDAMLMRLAKIRQGLWS